GPSWSGKEYQKRVGEHAKALRAQLEKLKTDEAEVRDAAGQALSQLEVRLAAAALALKQGSGEPVLTPARAGLAGMVKLISWGDAESVSCRAFSPDGKLLAVGIRYDSVRDRKEGGTIRGYLRLYDTATGAMLGDAGGTFGPVATLAFSGL